jgi:cysteinyl-tRNA synthetase
MSKSAGNVVLLSDVIARNLDPLALRFSLMENRYRSQMDLSWASLEASHATLKRWRNQVTQWGTSLEIKIDSEITDALTQDLDTPRAMQRLRSVEKDVTIGAQDKRAIFLYADLVLGLDLQRAPDNKPLTAQLEEILEMRAQSRAEKNWQKSDELRLELESHGLEINDGPQGQSWSWK